MERVVITMEKWTQYLTIKLAGSITPLFLLLLCQPALAVNSHVVTNQPKYHPAALGSEFASEVDLGYGYVDNVHYQADSLPHSGGHASFIHLSPKLIWLSEHNSDQYRLSYHGDYRNYQQSDQQMSNDSYDHHDFQFDGHWLGGIKHHFNLSLKESLQSQARGQGLTEGFSEQQFIQLGIDSELASHYSEQSFEYIYGSDEGQGKLSIALINQAFRFKQQSDYDTDFQQYMREAQWNNYQLNIELLDQYRSDTRMSYFIRLAHREYMAQEEKNSNKMSIGVGYINGDYFSDLTISSELLYLRQQFPDLVNAKTFNGINWTVSALWDIVDYSSLELYTKNISHDPSGAGGYIISTYWGGIWNHDWIVDTFSSQVEYTYEHANHEVLNRDRNDRYHSAKLALIYKFNPSVALELNYQYRRMISNKKYQDLYLGIFSQRRIVRTLGYDQRLLQLLLKVKI